MQFLVIAERTVRYRIVVEADDVDDAKWQVWHDPTIADRAEPTSTERPLHIWVVRPVED